MFKKLHLELFFYPYLPNSIQKPLNLLSINSKHKPHEIIKYQKIKPIIICC